MPGLESALVSIDGRASFDGRPGEVPMSLGWVIGSGIPAPVLEETGFSSVVLSLGSVDVSPTWGRVPAASQLAHQDSTWMHIKDTPCRIAAGTAPGHVTVAPCALN